MTQGFSYDPFDAKVMANPLPYYRVLRDEYPVYYLPRWDTFAVSRFDDIWTVLEVNDGTFVASVLSVCTVSRMDDAEVKVLSGGGWSRISLVTRRTVVFGWLWMGLSAEGGGVARAS